MAKSASRAPSTIVRELPVLVHAAHLAGLQGDDLRPQLPRAVSRPASNPSPPKTSCYPAKLVHGHIKWLLDKGVKTIFYPCVSYEENLVPNTDNHYNCPVVANYPLVVGANMPELREDDVRYMHPYFNLANHEPHG